MGWNFGAGSLERVLVLAVASFCMTGCAGGGGGDSAAAADSPGTVNGVPDSSSPGTTSSPDSDSGAEAAGNHAPTLSGTPTAAVVIDTEYSFQFAANDADGDALTLAVQNLPSWAQFDAESQRLWGTPAAGDTGTYTDI